MTVVSFQKIIAENIRGFRLKNRFSQEKLAILAEISLEHLGLIERGQTNPSVAVIFKISKALNIEPHKLLVPDAHKK
ncbi:MAG: helix-turn-helix domain-containing protein [Gloeomargaritales cyanobacterium]